MKLDKFYSLRAEFTVIGLTGRIGSGCSEIAKLLATDNFPDLLEAPEITSTDIDKVKYKICYNYVKKEGNWRKYWIIVYKNVLLLHLLYFATKNKTHEETVNAIWDLIVQNGASREATKTWKNRFDSIEDEPLFENYLRPFLNEHQAYLQSLTMLFGEGQDDLHDFLKAEPILTRELFFSEQYETFSNDFYDLLNKYNMVKRSRFTHDLANNLRSHGQLQSAEADPAIGLTYIYTIAHTINRLIKAWRSSGEPTKLIIDALKNSLELMYFKEKYAAFYMVATNKTEEERKKHVAEG